MPALSMVGCHHSSLYAPLRGLGLGSWSSAAPLLWVCVRVLSSYPPPPLLDHCPSLLWLLSLSFHLLRRRGNGVDMTTMGDGGGEGATKFYKLPKRGVRKTNALETVQCRTRWAQLASGPDGCAKCPQSCSIGVVMSPPGKFRRGERNHKYTHSSALCESSCERGRDG